MTQEQIKQLAELQIKQLAELQNIFNDRCSEITKILGKMDKYYNTGYFYSDTYVIDNDVVICEGDEY